MIKPIRNSYGYRNLLVYKKAEELQLELSKFVSEFKNEKTLIALADQMERSARSTKQNISEGWKRNSTGEYYQFLGFAIASNAELEEDFTDILHGVYSAKGIGKGKKWGEWEEDKIESTPFYPLDPLLPFPIKLKLRAKEINFLIDRLQTSLIDKMKNEGTLAVADRIRERDRQEQEAKKWFENYLTQQGMIRLENGRIIKKGNPQCNSA